MSDLISRKALVHGLMEDYEKCMSFDGLLNFIHSQPTAYDVDKVVEQLEEMRERRKADAERYLQSGSELMEYGKNCEVWAIDRAIFRVKEGAVKDE